jgi:hypothetical protein
MKKIIFCISLLILSHQSISQQNCDESERNSNAIIAAVSAGFLYNTYALIGSLADGYESNAFDEATLVDLFSAQKQMARNMSSLFEKQDTDPNLQDLGRKEYMRSLTAIIKEFELQMNLLEKMVQNKSRKNIEAYTTQRSKSWKDISKLMGAKD